MSISRIRWWQWIVMSLLIGFAVAKVRQSYETPFESFGHTMNDQRAFEAGLVKEYQGSRLFRGITVYPAYVPGDAAGETKFVHLVTGEYFSGKPVRDADSWRADWQRTCFIAAIPYVPIGVKRDSDDPSSTVLTYMAGLADQGVTFRHAWWAHPKWQTTFWTAGSFIVIGLLFPATSNLLTYGKLIAPREIRVAKSAAPARKPASVVGAPASDLSEVAQIGALLEAKLAADAAPRARESASPPAAAPVKQRDAEPLVVSGVNGAKDHKEFGQRQDDFYPTERVHVHHEDDGREQ